ncbi:MAG TPA: amidohydrolase family protein [Thermoanaerobaculia bacterium]|jgi:predicted TIM-barrel fold metal-dependent hydrolase|nr:amidohydrolase family protein [Thermoanaerobaculia bacterium]
MAAAERVGGRWPVWSGRSWGIALVAAACSAGLRAQTMSIEDYEPKSTLVVPEHKPQQAKYPFIDVHNHQDRDMSAAEAGRLVADMDRINLRVMVNLSGGQGAEFEKGYRNLAGRYPGRFIVFANLDFAGIESPGWGERAAAQLERDYRNGARGLKIFKNLGLTVTDASGRRVPVDDPRMDAVFEKCAALGIPVLIHSGEPRSFFDPQDKFNERWLELKQFPGRARPADKFPPFEQILTEQHHLFAKHPRTKFIDAHLGWLGGDLARLGALFDRLPNVYTEIGAVLAELGRQPRFAREWFIKYQDRIMFGKDTWAADEYPVYFRVLETDDEYFDYYRKRHAFWKMYGLALPDDVLRKLYYKNALRVIPGIDASAFPP